MNEFPSLADVLARHWVNNCWWHCDGGMEMTPATHAQHQADAWREACTIRTVEELDALPDGTIVRGANGHAFEKTSESWTFDNRRWGEAGNSSPDRSEDIERPALLIWSPAWARP